MMAETYVERVHTEDVVLDIGDSIGALILYADESWRGAEIELSPQGSDGRRVHSQVHERRINRHPVFAAVYPELPAGEYDIWRDESTPVGVITIVGGEVAAVEWPPEHSM